MTVPHRTHCELGDIVEFVNGGAWSQSAYSESGVPVVRVTDIRGDHIDLSECKHLPHELLHKYRKHLLRTHDLVIATVGSHPTQPNSVVGRPAVVSEKIDGCLLNQNAVLLRSRSSQVDQQWLGYLGKSSRFRSYIIECARGSANQVRMSIALLKKMPVEVPSLGTQRQVASILCAYDDLIEINRRRIAVLEEMARGLFEEWFVRFRFPGHEEVPILDTPDGPLPKGWTTQTVGETFNLLGGGTPSKAIDAYWQDGTIDWFTPTDLTGAETLFMDRSSVRITELGLSKSSARLFPAGSIMMTSRATIGAISICTDAASTNQGFITCLPNALAPRSYLYYWLALNVPLFIAHATGATFKEITKGVFKRLPITVPPSLVTEQFEKRVSSMHDMILALERSNRSLAASRDLLLPRLISGPLSVTQAERELEKAA